MAREIPRHARISGSRDVAELLLARFRAMGVDAHIEQFEAWMPRPVSRTLELVGPEHFTGSLREPALS